jgi:hypothetical protein
LDTGTCMGYNICLRGWINLSIGDHRPIPSLEPFKYCPWCSKKLTKP